MSSWRLIRSGSADGSRNMAVDEALLESCASGAPGFPCIRLYAFSPPCLSLGAHQPWRRSVDLGLCRSRGIEVVRRPTGGKAVLHDREVTYAVVARIGEAPFGTGVRGIYRSVSAALAAAYARLGVTASDGSGERSPGPLAGDPSCFAEPTGHEMAVGPWKVAGSAQVRRRGAFLQHGSLPLEMDADLLAAVTRGAGRERDARPAPDVRGLSRILGRRVEPEELERSILEAVAAELDARLDPGAPTPSEAARAEWLRAHKYLTAAWTLGR